MVKRPQFMVDIIGESLAPNPLCAEATTSAAAAGLAGNSSHNDIIMYDKPGRTGSTV